MKIQYFLIAVFTVVAFSVCSETNAQFFRQRFRQAARQTENAYPYAPTASQISVQTQHRVITQPTIISGPTAIAQTTIQKPVSAIENATSVVRAPFQTTIVTRNASKVHSPTRYKDTSPGNRVATNLGESYGIKDKYHETDRRHVYRPIKGGIQKAGLNGQTLILAEYIGTHRKGANEKRMGGFQDMQYGSVGQNFVKTDLAGKEMWVEPFLDGTLRWVPYILKD